MARSNKYASVNFNDIYEKKNPNKPSSTSSSFSPSSSTTNPQKPHLSTTRTHGGMLVLTRPSPKPQPQPQPQPQQSPPPAPKPDPDPTGFEPDSISLRPLGRTTSSLSSSPSTAITQERDRESPPSISLTKPEAFVPPHLRPGFVGREEKLGQDGRRQQGFRNRELGHGNNGQHGSPSRYGEDGRPKSGGM